MREERKWVGFCCVVILSVLYAVGMVRHGMLRNIVQTLPLWIPIVLALRKFVTAKPGQRRFVWSSAGAFALLFGARRFLALSASLPPTIAIHK